MSSVFQRLIRMDGALLLAVLTLVLIGVVTLYGIGMSSPTQDLFQFKKQIVGACIGLAFILGFLFLDYRMLRSLGVFFYVVGLLLLIAVLIGGVTMHGTRGWFVIGHLSFQPVEAAKVSLALFLASYLSRHTHERLSWTPFFGSALATALYIALVMLQPDFGSAMVMGFLWFGCIVFARLPRRAWWVLAGGVIVAGTLFWTVGLKPYQRARLESFLDPASDPRGAGYNVIQARIAIGSGGWLGKGIGEGSQARLRFLPEASTDFLFSVIGEELGFIGITIVLGLYGVCIYRLLMIAQGSRDVFAQMFLIGCISILMVHVLVNGGMNLGIMPVTGIPMPFLSAAVSSLIMLCAMMGIAQSIALHSSTSG